MTMATPDLASIDLSDIELFRHGFPHDVFTALREQAPVWRHPETPGVREDRGGPLLGGVHPRRRPGGEPRPSPLPLVRGPVAPGLGRDGPWARCSSRWTRPTTRGCAGS